MLAIYVYVLAYQHHQQPQKLKTSWVFHWYDKYSLSHSVSDAVHLRYLGYKAKLTIVSNIKELISVEKD